MRSIGLRQARLLGGGLVAISLVLAGCSADGDGSGGSSGGGDTIRVGIEEIPSQWLPGTDNGYAWVRVPYETLVARTADDPNEFVPQLAADWEIAADSLTFNLRDGVTFHDGTPFDAEAAKFNLEYVIEEQGPFSSGFDAVEEISAPDKHTLVLELSRPSQAVMSALTGRGGVMVSPTAIEDGIIKDHPVGTGPWAYDEDLSIAGSEIGFSRYDDHWDVDADVVDQVVLVAIDDSDARINALTTGEIDLGDVSVPQADQARSAGLTVDVYPGIHYGLLFLDRGPGGAVADVDARRAICQGLDVEGLAAAAGGEFLTATNQRFLEGEYGHNPDLPPIAFDPEQAEGTLDGRVPGLTMLAFEQSQQFAEALSGMLGEVGVDLEVQTVTAAEYFASWYDGAYSLGLGDNTELTPEEWYLRWFAANAPGNPAGVESETLDAAADAALAEPDPELAEPLWAEVMRIILEEEVLTCSEVLVNQAIGYDSDKIGGVRTVTWEPSSVEFTALERKD
ncbi:ABC transporter substrate-binding protein [Nocardioides silvaticus]|nr:ABC transporter substrate-binding protein [Nocardioides silvaticus]